MAILGEFDFPRFHFDVRLKEQFFFRHSERLSDGHSPSSCLAFVWHSYMCMVFCLASCASEDCRNLNLFIFDFVPTFLFIIDILTPKIQKKSLESLGSGKHGGLLSPDPGSAHA